MATTLRWVAPLGAALILYGCLSLYQVSLPGLYYDEAADAVPAMQLLQGQQPELIRQAGIQLFGRKLPLMAMDYVGAVHTYAAVPFFSLFGVNTRALRLMTVAGGAVTLALTYVWAGWLFRSLWVASAAALLLAVHLSYVFFARQGIEVSSLMALWAMAALLLLLAWRRTGAWWWLVPAALVLGLGLSTKILFLWFILALLAVYLLWRGGPLLQRIGRGLARSGSPGSKPRSVSPPVARPEIMSMALGQAGQTVAVLSAFLLGAAMLVMYNVQTGGTLEVLQRNALVSQYGVHNAEYFANLLVRLQSLGALLDGRSFSFLGGPFANPWYPAAFGLAAVSLPALLLWKPPARKHASATVFLLALIGLVLLQSPLTISGIWPTHLFILLPLLQVVIALALYLLGRHAFPAKGIWVVTGALVVLAASNLLVDIQYHRALQRTGGHGAHSDVIYALAAYLDWNGAAQPLAMDWGIKYNVQLLTQGRVNPLEIFQYQPEPDALFAQWLREAVARPEQLYLFHSPEHTAFPRFDQFHRTVGQLGKDTHLETTFRERDGTPAYLVYTVR